MKTSTVSQPAMRLTIHYGDMCALLCKASYWKRLKDQIVTGSLHYISRINDGMPKTGSRIRTALCAIPHPLLFREIQEPGDWEFRCVLI